MRWLSHMRQTQATSSWWLTLLPPTVTCQRQKNCAFTCKSGCRSTWCRRFFCLTSCRYINGKVDRRALPAPAEIALEQMAAHVEPHTHVEIELAQMWEQLLNRKRVSVHDNFFELGGHSLLATQVISRVREMFKIEIPLRSIFEARRSRISPSASSSRRARLARRPSLARHAIELYHSRSRSNDSGSWTRSFPAIRLTTYRRRCDSQARLTWQHFASTLNEIVQRHEILRHDISHC